MSCDIYGFEHSTDYECSATTFNCCVIIDEDGEIKQVTLKEYAIKEIKEQPYF